MKKQISIAIVGLGRAGQFHLNSINIIGGLSLHSVVDPQLQAEDAIVQENELNLASWNDVLSNDAIEAVVVSPPTTFHYEYITQALAAGKHVFAEKPLGKSVDEINTCYNLSEQNDLVLHLGFQRRFDHNFIKLKNQIPKIGQVRLIKTSSRDNPPPSIEFLKTSGNIFHDMLIHDFDMLAFLLDGMTPETIFVQAHAYHKDIAALHDFDTVMVNIKYPNGLMCHIDTSRTAPYGYDQRIELFGEHGMAIADNVKESTIQLYTIEGILQDNIEYSFPERYRSAYLREMEFFAEGVLTGNLYNVSRVDCLLSHLMVEAAHQSAITGQPIDCRSLFQL